MVKKKSLSLLICLLAFLPALAQNDGQQEKPDPLKIAEEEVTRMEQDLKLEYWQVFYLDSVLCHNYTELLAELEALQRSRVENSDLYMAVQDKWTERSQEAFKKYLSEEQWEEYLRNGGSKLIREREKRREKAAAATEPKEKKKKNKK